MIGNLKVTTKNTLPDEFARRVHQGVDVLRSHGIAVMHEQGLSSLEADLLIDVIEMGDISHAHIKPFLLALFPKKREVKGITAIVRDPEGNRQFEMPYDLGECVDWFRIE